jgi:hypothetical protein
MAQSGLVTPGATADNIAALQEGLANLTSSIESLSDDVAQLTQLVKATAAWNWIYLSRSLRQGERLHIYGAWLTALAPPSRHAARETATLGPNPIPDAPCAPKYQEPPRSRRP